MYLRRLLKIPLHLILHSTLLFLLASCQQSGRRSGATLSSESLTKSYATTEKATAEPTEKVSAETERSDFLIPQSFRAEHKDFQLVLVVLSSQKIDLMAFSDDPGTRLDTDYLILIEEHIGDEWQPVSLTRPNERGGRMINQFMRIFVEDDGSYTVSQDADIALSSIDGGFLRISYDLSDYTELKSGVLYRITKSFSVADSLYEEYEIEFRLNH